MLWRRRRFRRCPFPPVPITNTTQHNTTHQTNLSAYSVTAILFAWRCFPGVEWRVMEGLFRLICICICIWHEPRLTLPPPRLLPPLSQPDSVSTHKSLLLLRRLVRDLPDRRLSAWASCVSSSLPPCSGGRGLYRTSWIGRLVCGGGGFLGGCRCGVPGRKKLGK